MSLDNFITKFSNGIAVLHNYIRPDKGVSAIAHDGYYEIILEAPITDTMEIGVLIELGWTTSDNTAWRYDNAI